MTPTIHPSSKVCLESTSFSSVYCKTSVVALTIILGLGCLIVTSVSLGAYMGWWQAGSLNTLSQVHAIALLVTSGFAGLTSFMVGIVLATVKSPSMHIEKKREISSQAVEAFGDAEWKTYFREVEKAPPLPDNIKAILNAQCPFTPNQKVRDTHLLVYIPSSVRGHILDKQNLQDLAQNPLQGQGITLTLFADIVEFEDDEGGWVLMTKRFIPNPQNVQTRDELAQLLEPYEDYRRPYASEAAICLMASYFMKEEPLFQNGQFFYCEDSRNSEHGYIFAGDFTKKGFSIITNPLPEKPTFMLNDGKTYGAVALRLL